MPVQSKLTSIKLADPESYHGSCLALKKALH